MEKVAQWFAWVQNAVAEDDTTAWFYFPTLKQGNLSETEAGYLAERGIVVDSPSRCVEQDQCYSEGWAFGKVVFVKSGEISAAYQDGGLSYADILVTDGVPAEIPLVAGVVSLTAATPNSHVALLSRSYGIPFVLLARAEDRERVLSQVGDEFILVAERAGSNCVVNLLNVEGGLTTEQRTILENAKVPPALEIVAMARAGVLSRPVDDLTPNDLAIAGGKAANFGFLRRAIPEATPSPAIVFTFDLWQDYLDQPVWGGGTLRERINGILAKHTFPPDAALLAEDLGAVRELIKSVADFTLAQKNEILAALSGFEEGRRIRFRSSTNMEDSAQFIGAGLYDSFSGCPADDLEKKALDESGLRRAFSEVLACCPCPEAFQKGCRFRAGLEIAEFVTPLRTEEVVF